MRLPGVYKDANGPTSGHITFNMNDKSPSAWHGTLSTDGIEGARPRQLTQQRSKPLDALDVSDISGSQYSQKSSKALRNPLDPDYNLPPLPPPPPVENERFVRDTMDISDIKGATRAYSILPSPVSRACRSLDSSDITVKHKRQWNIVRNTLDISDIVTTPENQQRYQRAAGLGKNTEQEDFGMRKDLDWKIKHYELLRRRADREKAAVSQTTSVLLPTTNSASLIQLELELRSYDRSKSGRVCPADIKRAFDAQGLSKEEQNRAVKQLVESDGLINYKRLLSQLYDSATSPGGSLSASTKEELPSWYQARQRGLTTSVGLALDHSTINSGGGGGGGGGGGDGTKKKKEEALIPTPPHTVIAHCTGNHHLGRVMQ